MCDVQNMCQNEKGKKSSLEVYGVYEFNDDTNKPFELCSLTYVNFGHNSFFVLNGVYELNDGTNKLEL